MQQHIIKTARLLMRPPILDDAPIFRTAIEETFSTLHRWMPWARGMPSLETTRRYLEDCMQIWVSPLKEEVERVLQIIDKMSGDFIGAIGFKPHNTEIPSFEVGYWVRERHRGHGHITEAGGALVYYLFKHYKARRVEIRCEVANRQSAAVAERLGFELEAILKNHRMKPDGSGPTDTLVYVRTDVVGLPPVEDLEWS